MQVESVRGAAAVERDDERQRPDLASEVQVHRVKQREKPEAEDVFDHAHTPQQGKLVWLREEKKAVYRVIEAETGEIIQQVPSDEVMRVARNLEKFLISVDPEMDSQT
jgi:uncharacterized iron-regulated membrane protein